MVQNKISIQNLGWKKTCLVFWMAHAIQRVWSSVRKSMIFIERTKRKTNQVKQDGWKGAMEFELTQFKVIDLLTWWHRFYPQREVTTVNMTRSWEVCGAETNGIYIRNRILIFISFVLCKHLILRIYACLDGF